MSTSPMQQTPSIHIVARLSLPLIALLAFGLRLYQLTDEPMWMDETRQILIATTSTSAAEIIDRAAQQQQPPLDYLLLALVAMIGYSDLLFRLPAAIYGSSAVLATGWLARRLTGSSTVASVAALWLAVQPFHVQYSQEVRPYALISLLCTLSLVAFLWACDTKRWYAWLLLSLIEIAAVHAHPFMIHMVGAQMAAIALLFTYRRWRRPTDKSSSSLGIATAASGLTVLIVVAAASIPILTYLQARLGHWVEAERTLTDSVRDLTQLLGPRLADTAFHFGAPLPWLVLAGFLLGVLWLLLRGDDHGRMVAIALPLAACMLVGYASWAGAARFRPRYAILLQPAYLTLAAAGTYAFLSLLMYRLPARWRNVDASTSMATLLVGTVAGMVMATGLPAYYAAQRKVDHRAAIRQIEKQWNTGDPIISEWAYREKCEYYLPEPMRAYWNPLDRWTGRIVHAPPAEYMHRTFFMMLAGEPQSCAYDDVTAFHGVHLITVAPDTTTPQERLYRMARCMASSSRDPGVSDYVRSTALEGAGRSMLTLGHWHEAERLLRELKSHKPRKAAILLAVALLNQNRVAEAATEAQAAYELPGGRSDPEVLEYVAAVREAQERYVDAAQFWQDCFNTVQQTRKVVIASRAAAFHLRHNLLDGAELYVAYLLERHPGHAVAKQLADRLQRSDADGATARQPEPASLIQETPVSTVVTMDAVDFIQGNASTQRRGEEPCLLSGDTKRPHWAEFAFDLQSEGFYGVWVRYAAGDARTCTISVNGHTLNGNAMQRPTGGWNSRDAAWMHIGALELSSGEHSLRVQANQRHLPHIFEIRIAVE